MFETLRKNTHFVGAIQQEDEMNSTFYTLIQNLSRERISQFYLN